jgi:hypothetical protein
MFIVAASDFCPADAGAIWAKRAEGAVRTIKVSAAIARFMGLSPVILIVALTFRPEEACTSRIR